MYKVIVVEDERIIRKGLIYALDWLSFDCNIVAEASNGLEGIEMIKLHNPDIVIVDINMPIINGIEMIKQTVERYSYSPIIVSGHHEFDYAKQAITYGVSEYILKPIDHEELKLAIVSAIKQIEMKKSYRKQLQTKDNIRSYQVMDNDELNCNDKSLVVTRMIKYIKDNYQAKVIMQDLVEELKCSTTQLNSKFRSETGTTFNDFLNRYRIQMVIGLMKERDAPLYKIAERTGFKDYKYFNMVFKKYTGYTASEFVTSILSD